MKNERKSKNYKISEDDNLITGEVAGTPIANVKFEIYDDSGKLVDTLITKQMELQFQKIQLQENIQLKKKKQGNIMK